jgi:hypothetical protein
MFWGRNAIRTWILRSKSEEDEGKKASRESKKGAGRSRAIHFRVSSKPSDIQVRLVGEDGALLDESKAGFGLVAHQALHRVVRFRPVVGLHDHL